MYLPTLPAAATILITTCLCYTMETFAQHFTSKITTKGKINPTTKETINSGIKSLLDDFYKNTSDVALSESESFVPLHATFSNVEILESNRYFGKTGTIGETTKELRKLKHEAAIHSVWKRYFNERLFHYFYVFNLFSSCMMRLLSRYLHIYLRFNDISLCVSRHLK